MPKAAMHKHHDSSGRKYQVGSTGQPAIMKAIAQAGGMQRLADSHFRLGVARAHQCHLSGTGEIDRHSKSLRWRLAFGRQRDCIVIRDFLARCHGRVLREGSEEVPHDTDSASMRRIRREVLGNARNDQVR